VPTPPSRLPTGERLRRAGIGAWSIIGIVILVAMALWALLRVRIIFAPLGLALLIIYILNPIVSWLERHRVPRLLGALGAYIVVLGGLTLGVLATIPVVSDQVTDVREHWPEYRAEIVTFVDDTAQSIDDTFGTEINTSQVPCLLGAEGTEEGVDVTAAECNEITSDFRDAIVDNADQLTHIGSSVLEGLLVFIIAPLIALYLLIDLPHVQNDLLGLVPERYKGEVTDVAGKVGSALGGFFRGQLLVALTVGILSAIGFRIIGLPFWFVIAAIAGFFNLVPLIGPYIGGAIGFFVGLISEGIGLGIKAAIVELIVQQIDNHIVSPNVMKRTVNLHPATVMLSLLAGGAVAGFWGVLLGVPAVAVAKLVLGHIWQTRVLGKPVSPILETPDSGETAGVPEPSGEQGSSVEADEERPPSDTEKDAPT
jgi:predicted PurR-regulated permease PerM